MAEPPAAKPPFASASSKTAMDAVRID